MKLKIIIVLCLLLPLVVYATKPIKATELEISELQLTPKETISMYARQYGASEIELLAIAKCESSFNPNAFHKNDGGKGKHSVGIYQYQEATFNGFDNLLNEDLDYYSYHDQIKLTAYVFAKYPKLKSHWSCYRIYKKSLA